MVLFGCGEWIIGSVFHYFASKIGSLHVVSMARDEQRIVCGSDFKMIEIWTVGAFKAQGDRHRSRGMSRKQKG